MYKISRSEDVSITTPESVIIKVLVLQAMIQIIFFILQKRELKRFFQQQTLVEKEEKASKKEEQLSCVLNSTSDGILVI